MTEELYKVFCVDISFDKDVENTVLIGAKSIEDLIEHLKVIWPDNVHFLKRYKDTTDEEWQDETENGKYKEGDAVLWKFFNDEELEEMILNKDYQRIYHIPHMYSDRAYEVLKTYYNKKN